MNATLRSLILVLLLWVAGLCAAGQFAKIAVPFAEFRALYPEAGSTIGWLLSLISFVGAVAGLIAGGLVSFFGLRRMLLGGLLLGSAMSLWQASLPAFPFFAASRVLEGASQLAIVIAVPTFIAHLSSPRWRGPAMSLWSSIFGVMFALVAWMGMPLVQAYGVPSLFLAHGILTAVIAGTLALLLKKSDMPEAAGGPLHIKGLAGGLIAALRAPQIAAPGVGWLFYTLTFVALLAILPERMDAEDRDTLSGFLPLLSIFVALTLVPGLMSVIKANTIVLIGFGCSLLAVVLGGPFSLPVLCIALYAALGLVQGSGYASVPELNDTTEARTLSFGLMAQTGNIGNLAGTPLFLFALDRRGEAGLIYAVAGIYACALVSLILLKRRQKRIGTLPAANT